MLIKTHIITVFYMELMKARKKWPWYFVWFAHLFK